MPPHLSAYLKMPYLGCFQTRQARYKPFSHLCLFLRIFIIALCAYSAFVCAGCRSAMQTATKTVPDTTKAHLVDPKWPPFAQTSSGAGFEGRDKPGSYWSYGVSTGPTGKVTPFTVFTTTGPLQRLNNGTPDPNCQYLPPGNPIYVEPGTGIKFNPGFVTVHPGPNDQCVHVRFTVPVDGMYRFSCSGERGRSGATATIYTFLNGVKLHEAYPEDWPEKGISASYGTDYALRKKGDVFDCVVGAGRKGFGGNTTSVNVGVFTWDNPKPKHTSSHTSNPLPDTYNLSQK
jgi:hypothetical protein